MDFFSLNTFYDPGISDIAQPFFDLQYRVPFYWQVTATAAVIHIDSFWFLPTSVGCYFAY